MKYKLFLFAILGILLFTSLAAAEVKQSNNAFYGIIEDDGSLTKTTTPITNFNAIGFVCADSNCENVNGTLWNGNVLNSGSKNTLDLIYPTKLQQSGYGIYFYKQGYFPFEAKSTLAGSGNANQFEVYLTKVANCEVPINHLIISHVGNKVIVNVTLNAGVSSPVVHAGPLEYIPSSIVDHYSVKSKVDFRFIGPQNVSTTESVTLAPSESKEIFTSVENLAAGQYRIEVESNTVDDKCISSVSNSLNSNLLIEDNRTNETLPLIAIVSPESKTYTNRTILVELKSVNATSVFYNWNGVNITYTSPIYITFNEGSNTLTAYAKNNVTTAFTSVSFKVDTSIPPNPITCTTNLQCGQQTFTEFMCTNQTTRQFLFTTPTCINPGTTASFCKNLTQIITDPCEVSCVDGTCVGKLDLSISNGFTEPSQLYTNSQNAVIRFYTNNTGNSTLTVPVKILFDGVLSTAPAFQNLPFQAGYNVWGVSAFPEILTEGYHNMTIIIDPNNTINETNENNNEFFFEYNVLFSNQTFACYSNADCNDNNSDTIDICHFPGTTKSFCSNNKKSTGTGSSDYGDSAGIFGLYSDLGLNNKNFNGLVNYSDSPIALNIPSDSSDSAVRGSFWSWIMILLICLVILVLVLIILLLAFR